MSDHEHDALDALRELDGPADLGDGVQARLEAAVLARFDDRVNAEPADETWTLVALEDAREQTERRRLNRLAMAVAAAAAVAVIAAGTIVVLTRDEPAPATRPPTTATTTTVSTTVDESAIADQLSVYCADYIVPLRDADELWRPDRVSSESRTDVLIATEQAAAAMSELTGSLGERLSSLAEQTLEAATDARLADVLGEADADETVGVARDLVFTALSTSGVAQLPASCLP